jgi:hypothetical protein
MTMPSKEWARWVEAAKILAADPKAKVRCPRNQDGFLEVEDGVTSTRPRHIERYLRCPMCGATNVIKDPSG